MTKRLFTVLALCGLLLGVQAQSAPAAHAIQQLIKNGASEPVPVMVTDASGNPVTGIASSGFTLTVRRPGASAYVAALGTIAEDGNGVYDYTPTSAETTLTTSKNILLVHAVVTATTTSFGDASAQIVAFDPTDPSVSGLTGVATSATQTTNTTTLGTVNTNVSAINAKLGTPAGASVSADIAANRTAINGIPALTTTAVWAATLRTLTGQSDSAGVTTLLVRLPQTLSFTSGNVNAAAQTLPSPVPAGYGPGPVVYH